MSRPVKRRKTTSAVEEITFDTEAREDYLTGFHKRKQQRIKHAQEEAAKKEKEFRIEQRKHIREQRQKDLQKHVETVNAMIKKPMLDDSDVEETDGNILAPPSAEVSNEEVVENDVGREDEYVDEDKYTTVTIEPMRLSESEDGGGDGSETENNGQKHDNGPQTKQRTWTKQKPSTSKPKKKRQKFRYETKGERKTERLKQKSKNSAAAKARRSGGRD